MSNVEHDITSLESLFRSSSDEANNDELRMSDAERQTLQRCIQLLKREPLVQEVIAKHMACIEAYKAWRFAVAEEALFEAVQNLAAWKP